MKLTLAARAYNLPSAGRVSMPGADSFVDQVPVIGRILRTFCGVTASTIITWLLSVRAITATPKA